MRYRSEIDGLRAIAVIPVILFHAGFSLFSGGFVGVDVFFVISGYLITSIILKEKEKGMFSLGNFYERRARRIFPALFLVMFFSIPLAYLWFTPPDLKDFFQSVFATTTFLSNFLFFSESGYFETATELKPLLHTWSLSVEEQFYVFFPLLILSTWRMKKKYTVWLFSIIAIASLSLAQYASINEPKAAFYLLPTRFWELLIGSFVAFYLLKNKIKKNEALSMLGVLLIMYSIFVFDANTPFPSLYTLTPTLGTALIILFTTDATITHKLLSHRALVGVGLISYSAYLWHFPLLAFAKYRNIEPLTNQFIIVIIGITLIFAYLTYKYIETPVRNKQKISRKRVITISAICSLFFIMIGIYGHTSNGFSIRGNFPKMFDVETVSDFNCSVTNTIYGGCLFGKNPKIAIIGDSHAQAIFNEYRKISHKEKYSAVGYTCQHSAPLLKSFRLLDINHNCVEQNQQVFKKIIENKKIETVVLIAQWANYTKGYRDNDKPSLVALGEEVAQNISDNARLFDIALQQTIKKLIEANKKIVIVNPVPEFSVKVQNHFARTSHFGYSEKIPTVSIKDYLKRNKEVFDAFKKLNNVEILNTSSIFCNNGLCRGVSNNGDILYSDTNHVTEHGARPIVQELTKIIDQ